MPSPTWRRANSTLSKSVSVTRTSLIRAPILQVGETAAVDPPVVVVPQVEVGPRVAEALRAAVVPRVGAARLAVADPPVAARLRLKYRRLRCQSRPSLKFPVQTEITVLTTPIRPRSVPRDTPKDVAVKAATRSIRPAVTVASAKGTPSDVAAPHAIPTQWVACALHARAKTVKRVALLSAHAAATVNRTYPTGYVTTFSTAVSRLQRNWRSSRSCGRTEIPFMLSARAILR